MENGKVNILLVCGFGMGTSTMAELNVKKALVDYNIEANLRHTSLGQMNADREWADIIFILKNLYNYCKYKYTYRQCSETIRNEYPYK